MDEQEPITATEIERRRQEFIREPNESLEQIDKSTARWLAKSILATNLTNENDPHIKYLKEKARCILNDEVNDG